MKEYVLTQSYPTINDMIESGEVKVYIDELKYGDIDKYAVALKSGGMLILSGFYTQDVPMIEQSANNCGLTLISVAEKKNWANMCLVKE